MTPPVNLPNVVIEDFPHAFKMTIDGKVLNGVKGYAIAHSKDGPAEVAVTFQVENVDLKLGPDED